MELKLALDFLRPRRDGVFATIRGDGRPQLSNILYHLGDDIVRISANAGAAKLANIARDPRVLLHVTSNDFAAYVVVEGAAAVTPPADAADHRTVDQLVEWYRAAAGEHPDWDDFRRAIVRDRRVLISVHPGRAYGYLPIS